jgi:hypothetical protein
MLAGTTTSEIGGHVKRLLILLFCLSALIVAAGCGGGDSESSGSGDSSSASLSKEDYEQQMQALQANLSGTADELTSAFSNPDDLEAMAGGLRDAADLMDEASAGLDEITPPEDVAEPHQVMVDKTASAADTLREFADTIETTPVTEIQSKLAEFAEIEEFAELEKAVADIKAAGYDIGGTS